MQNHFVVEKAKRMALPEFMILSHARRRLKRVLPKLLEKRKKFIKLDSEAISRGLIDDVNKEFTEMQRTEKRIINNIELIMMDVIILMERKLQKLIKTFDIVKHKQPKYAIEIKQSVEAIVSLFKTWFERVIAYERGSRTYISAKADVLFHEANHILWAMRFIDSRGQQRIQKKIKSTASKGAKNANSEDAKKTEREDKKFFQEAKALNSKLKKIITESDTFHKDMLQASLQEEQDFESDSNKIILHLTNTGFPKDELEKIQQLAKERKKEFEEFLLHQQNWLNSIIKLDDGKVEETKEMKEYKSSGRKILNFPTRNKDKSEYQKAA
jgi:hypothetical protein